MESSIFVPAPIKGVFWHFKIDRRIYLSPTVCPSQTDSLSVDNEANLFMFIIVIEQSAVDRDQGVK